MPFLGQQPLVGGYHVLDNINASSTNTYNLLLNGAAFHPASANHLLVSLNGVIQKPGSAFTVSGTQITFVPASGTLSGSDSIDFIMALGDVMDVGTPTDGTISSVKIMDNAVTTAKIPDNAVITAKIPDDAITSPKLDTNINITGSLGIGAASPAATLHTASSSGHHYIERFLAGDAAGPGITFRKSRASSQGGTTAAAQNDILGQIYFQGADGNSFDSAAYIRAKVDSAVADGDVRTTLQFATGASGSLASALEINSDKLCRMYLINGDHNYVVNAASISGAGTSSLHNLNFKADSSVFTGYHYYAKKEPTILYVDGDTIPSGKKIGDVKTQGETFVMGDVIVYENGKVTKCTKAKATNVVGIYSGHPMPGGRWLSNNKDDIATEEHALEVASVGDSQDWNKTVTHYLTGFKVCNENGAISSGDLLCSASKTGYLAKQDGTTITTATVGKSMDTVSFKSDGTATGIYGFIYCG